MPNFLALPGLSGHFVDTPDDPDLDITGDLSLRAFPALNVWTPSTENRIIAKWQGTERSYLLAIFTDGTIRFAYSTTGSDQVIIDSSAATGFAGGAIGGIRADFDVDAGASDNEVTFFTAVARGAPWVQLGSVVNNPGTVTINSGTAILEVGSGDGGGFGLLDGRVYDAQVLDGIGGTLVAHFNADDFLVGDSDTDTAVGETSKTWTIHGAGSLIGTDEGHADHSLIASIVTEGSITP